MLHLFRLRLETSAPIGPGDRFLHSLAPARICADEMLAPRAKLSGVLAWVFVPYLGVSLFFAFWFFHRSIVDPVDPQNIVDRLPVPEPHTDHEDIGERIVYDFAAANGKSFEIDRLVIDEHHVLPRLDLDDSRLQSSRRD
jgi:hypothetical protein